MIRRCLVILVVVLSYEALISCSQGKKIERKIAKMSEEPIRVVTEGMLVCNVLDSILQNADDKSKLKMVVWADSSECSQCYIRHLDMWKGFVELERENPSGIQYFFILETVPEKLEEMITMIQDTQLDHSIYIDTAQYFRQHNPTIPSDVMFHTFLLDSDNKVILVGNPTKNKSIYNLLNKILDENLGISMKDNDSL